jgi:hypothetical protein
MRPLSIPRSRSLSIVAPVRWTGVELCVDERAANDTDRDPPPPAASAPRPPRWQALRLAA